MPTTPASPEVHQDSVHPLEPWFDQFREEWDARRARIDPADGAKKRKAVFTMVHNEAVMLPVWLRYYSRYFAPEDIYVLDHDSDDGSTEAGGFNRIPVHNPEFDNIWQLEMVQDQQARLLEDYDIVLFTDVDEIVVPRPRLGDLTAYMNRFGRSFVNCMGYEIIHLPDREPPFDPERPVTEQRSHWFENSGYSKAVLVTEPSEWEPGFHRRADGHFKPDPDLFMVHLHRVDYDLALERHRNWRRRRWSKRRLEQGWGAHNAITDEAEFREWYFGGSGFRGVPIRIEEMPAEWRGAF
jgi:hypothetical protein